MFVSEDLEVLDEAFHPMAMLCWQSENPHTLSRQDCREDLRETFGRRNWSNVKIYDTQIHIAGNVAALSCKEIHSFEDIDIEDKYLVDMTFVKSQGSWRILTKVTTRQTNLAEPIARGPAVISAQEVLMQYGQPDFWGRLSMEGSDGSFGICGPGRSYEPDWYKQPAPTQGGWLYVYVPEGASWSPDGLWPRDTVQFVSIKNGRVERTFSGRLVFFDP